MAVKEVNALIRAKDSAGDSCLIYPITKKENVDGMDEIDAHLSEIDTLLDSKSDTNHTHANATTTDSGMMSSADKVKMDGIEERATHGIPIIQMTSTDGIAYTATIDGIMELTAGMTYLFVPNMTTTSTTPTLNVNGSGACKIRRKLSIGTATGASGELTTMFYANRPTLLMYDTSIGSNKFWFALEFTKPCAIDLYGYVPVRKGGTYVDSVTTDEEISTLRDNLGLYSKADHDWTMIYDSGEITEAVNAISGINITGYKKLCIAVKCVNDGTNSTSKNGAATFTSTNGVTYQFPVFSTMFSNSVSTTGSVGIFEIIDGWIMCTCSPRTLRANNFLPSEGEGGTADNLANSYAGLLRCTNTLSTLMISAVDQNTDYYLNAGSRVIVWGCKA